MEVTDEALRASGFSPPGHKEELPSYKLKYFPLQRELISLNIEYDYSSKLEIFPID